MILKGPLCLSANQIDFAQTKVTLAVAQSRSSLVLPVEISEHSRLEKVCPPTSNRTKMLAR